MSTSFRVASRLFVALVWFATAWLPAQSWSQDLPSLAPSARSHTGLAHDIQRWTSVLFGGWNGTVPLADTWEWNSGVWTPRLAIVRPPARYGHGMVFDARRGRVVLSGGTGSGGTILGDTWEWNGIWVQIAASGAPPARTGAGMVYDSTRGVVVRFGGVGVGGVAWNDTWELDGATWTQRTTSNAPAARSGAAMAYDSRSRKTLLFSGGNGAQTFADMWTYDATDWVQVTGTVLPPARTHAGIGFDTHCGRAVLFGGTSGAGSVLGDAWSWDGTNWQQDASGSMPSARTGVGLTYEEQYKVVRTFGGLDGSGPGSDQWARSNPCSRSMSVQGSVTIGSTATFGYSYPSAATNHFSWMLFTTHLAGSTSTPIAGFPVIGLARVHPFEVFAEPGGFLTSGGIRNELVTIPNSSALVGVQFDVQSVDVDLDMQYVWWADNDVESTIGSPPPTAIFTATPTSGLAPLTVSFTNSSTWASSYLWAFGDGTFSGLHTPPPKVYTTPGVYQVSLTATSPYGSNQQVQAIDVIGGAIASFSVTPPTGLAPLVVTFTNQSQNATSYAWDFGDGTTSTTANPPPKTYPVGSYTVTLIASNFMGVDVTTRSVNATAPVPVVNFTATPTVGALPLTVQFTDTSTGAPNAWQWDFDNDGTIDSTLVNPQFTYTVAGNYSVRLVATNQWGPGTLTRYGLILAGVTPTLVPVMVPIPAGTYIRGGAFGGSVAMPVHQVTLTQPFWMSRHEITQGQYQNLMGGNPSYYQGVAWSNAPQRPVEQVTWVQATAYCAALNAAMAGTVPSGYQYRLPTEAEWEYCCRAGTTTDFSTGGSLLCGQANHNPGNPCVPSGLILPAGQTTPVGIYAANAFGLHDMHGNVTEWCHDSWDLTANYPATPVVDPVVTTGTYRVIRGGSWNSPPALCASPTRLAFLPDAPFFTSSQYGFRVVLAPIIP